MKVEMDKKQAGMIRGVTCLLDEIMQCDNLLTAQTLAGNGLEQIGDYLDETDLDGVLDELRTARKRIAGCGRRQHAGARKHENEN